MTASGHRKRFESWRKKLPETTSRLVELVLERVVPEFEARGFVWYPDFAGGKSTEIGANEIPLQRRSGDRWPTVQLTFDERKAPCLHVSFGTLPPICRGWRRGAMTEIPREEALVGEGGRLFALCKGSKPPCEFGYRGFTLFPLRRVESEVEALVARLPDLFRLFDDGIPPEWFSAPNGRVVDHVLAMPRMG